MEYKVSFLYAHSWQTIGIPETSGLPQPLINPSSPILTTFISLLHFTFFIFSIFLCSFVFFILYRFFFSPQFFETPLAFKLSDLRGIVACITPVESLRRLYCLSKALTSYFFFLATNENTSQLIYLFTLKTNK